ncbi:hypothetical protein [Haloarcula onubensis]|uniref:Rpa-associated protein n=1 Tax=Haloarcula onubensis TaxID=2950539 RepID=A0ABU2FTF9_9EURY|nr:hypothetical protein [Halomicroarcula sp. S3CR25-11]MDS0283714.1 hypothetical protein [Halomicroarcula sp. S3CR25-11]
MSESGDSGPGRREVAHRIFAAEFDDAEFSYSESDEERAPNYVVTPTGARVNRLFVVGVLTELEQVNDEVLRARIVDPTGPFVVYAGQYQPEALAFLEAATPPLFVAVTGKARTFEPEDGDRVFTSVRPESISEVDAETRDRWVVQATEQTVARVGRMASARQSDLSGDALRSALVAAGVTESDAAGTTLALDYYDTTGDYLQAVRDLALNAARVVAGERDEAGSLSRDPGEGSDGPLPALAMMTLEAAAEAASAESSEEPAETDVDEPTTADAEPEETATPETDVDEPTTADTEAAEPATVDTDESATPENETTGSTTDGEPSSTAEPDATGEPTDSAASAESEPSTETSSETASQSAESDEPVEPTTEPESTPETTDSVSADMSADEGSSGTLGDFDSSTDGDEAVDDFDTEFELDEEEREEIEAEYGTDFQSGTEVDDAGEADIETPDPEDLAEAEAMDPNEAADAETEAQSVAAEEATADTAETADATDSGPDEDVDLEDAVMAAMTDLNDGGGADREAVVDAVVETHGADPAAVEDAIQDALMGGRCYEPDDGKLTPI